MHVICMEVVYSISIYSSITFLISVTIACTTKTEIRSFQFWSPYNK